MHVTSIRSGSPPRARRTGTRTRSPVPDRDPPSARVRSVPRSVPGCASAPRRHARRARGRAAERKKGKGGYARVGPFSSVPGRRCRVPAPWPVCRIGIPMSAIPIRGSAGSAGRSSRAGCTPRSRRLPARLDRRRTLTSTHSHVAHADTPHHVHKSQDTQTGR